MMEYRAKERSREINEEALQEVVRSGWVGDLFETGIPNTLELEVLKALRMNPRYLV